MVALVATSCGLHLLCWFLIGVAAGGVGPGVHAAMLLGLPGCLLIVLSLTVIRLAHMWRDGPLLALEVLAVSFVAAFALVLVDVLGATQPPWIAGLLDSLLRSTVCAASVLLSWWATRRWGRSPRASNWT